MQSGCCEAAVIAGAIVAVLISSAGQSGRRKAATTEAPPQPSTVLRGRREAAAIANFGSNFPLELSATLSELLTFAAAGQLPCRQPFTRRSAACHWYRGRSYARC